LAVTSPTSGGRSVGTVRSRAQATEFVCLFVLLFFFLFVEESERKETNQKRHNKMDPARDRHQASSAYRLFLDSFLFVSSSILKMEPVRFPETLVAVYRAMPI
jgi:hypothetical protein